MLTWTDSAFVLAARPHGETSAVVQLLTLAHGRHAGLVRGGQGRRQRPVLQAGNRVSASWSARLADHLGNLTLELEAANAAAWLDDPLRLSALASAAAISELVLPEREPHPACFEAFQALVGALETEHWAEVYVQWELLLLRELGFGLDLTRCAATGSNDQLAYVSPRERRIASRAEDMLEPMLGNENFRIRVAANVDFAQVEETREVLDGEPILLSETSVVDNTTNPLGMGIPGALANQPPVPADPDAEEGAA
ncbi:MAG: DNA repair protein RecO, partial [Tistlia sp.]